MSHGALFLQEYALTAVSKQISKIFYNTLKNANKNSFTYLIILF